jgi:hypothetical protein
MEEIQNIGLVYKGRFKVFLVSLHYDRGNEHARNGNIDAAISEYKRSIELCNKVELPLVGKEFLSLTRQRF